MKVNDINERRKEEDELKQKSEELERKFQQLKESEGRFRLIVENIKDYSIIMLDPNGYIKSWNFGAERIEGYSANEIVGKHISIVYTGDEILRKEPERNLKMAKEEGRIESEGWRVRKDGSKFFADVIITALYDDNNNFKGYAKITRDITERREAEAKTKKIIDTALDAVVSMNEKGKVTGWNKQAEHIFGYSEKEALGALMSNLIIPPVYREAHNKGLNHFLKTGEQKLLNKRIEITAIRKNGTEFPVELAILPIYTAGKYSFSAFLRDVSEQKQWQQQLIDYNYELQKVNAELDRFVYSISHDLRAPLTNILGLLNIMDFEKNQKQRKVSISKARNAVKRLDGFIKIILDYSRNYRLEIKPALINFEELIAESWGNYSYIKGAEKIRLDLKIQQKVPFVSDKGRITIILNNLISNSIIYRNPAERKPCIDIEIEVDKEFAHMVIKDNGIGIEKEYQKKVFEMFFRASPVSTGSGLGLYIVKEVVAKLGGNIKMKSELQKGTAILIDLPNKQLC